MKTNKEKVIKKVRKEIKPKEDTNLMHILIAQDAALQYFKNKTAQKIEVEIKENHTITPIIVWLAILTVLAIYVSIK